MTKFGDAFTRALLDEDTARADLIWELQQKWLARNV
jgi:hypothetical protein